MKFIRFCFSTLLVVMCLGIAQADTVYSVGVVPQFDARQTEAVWVPLLREVSQRSGVKLKLVPSPSVSKFERQFKVGKFQFAYMNPYHAIVANRSQNYVPLVRDVDDKLCGIIVVHKDSPITSVDQLDSKTIAMPAPNALGASLLPRAELSNLFKIAPTFRYVNSHDSVYLNVVVGTADAGGGVMRTLERQSQQVRDKLRILYTTQQVAAHPFMAHPAVPAGIMMRVQQAFVELGQSVEGKTLLKGIPMGQPGIATLQDYQPLIGLGLERFYVREAS